MTEGYIPQTSVPPNGIAGLGSAALPDDFSGDDVWRFTYNFGKYAPASKPIKGEVPTPTQPRIDSYERDLSRITVELEHAAGEETRALARLEASQGEGRSVEEAMAGVERAFALKSEVLEKLKDAMANFCGGHPTRKQFDLLPENALFAFNNAIRKKLSPNF